MELIAQKCKGKTPSTKTFRTELIQNKGIQSPSPSSRAEMRANVQFEINWKKCCQSNYHTLGNPKAANTFLKLLHNALPCLQRLQRWRGGTFLRGGSSICKICMKANENVLHIFTCPNWKSVWRNTINIIKPCLKSGPTVHHLITNTFVSDNKRLVHAFIHETLHQIWLARNSLLFENIRVTADVITFRIQAKILSALSRILAKEVECGNNRETLEHLCAPLFSITSGLIACNF